MGRIEGRRSLPKQKYCTTQEFYKNGL